MPIAESILQEGPLASFLRSHQATKGSPISVTGMGCIKKTWSFQDEEYPQFLDLLHDYLFVDNHRPINLVEQRRPEGIMPGLIDLDFKYAIEGSMNRRFAASHIKAFLGLYIRQLEALFDLSESKPITFFVSLRPTPYECKKNKAVKDGIHIQYDLELPFDQQLALRKSLMSLKAIETAFAGTGYTNSEEDIYDAISIKNGAWFFYGESKPDIPAYSLTQVYSYSPASKKLMTVPKETYTPRQLMSLLSVRNLKGVTVEPTAALEPLLEKYAAPKATNTLVETEEAAKIFPTWLSVGYTEGEVALAKTLVERCLSVARADGYESWREVGWCLHEISDTEEMFHTWMNFSEKSPKFRHNDISKLQREWTSGWRAGPKRLTIRSLHMWAKQDNPAEYKKIMDDDIVEFVLRHVNNTHNHVAQLMHRMFWGDFRASINKKSTDWFEFRSPCWKPSPQAVTFRNRMSTDVAAVIQKAKGVSQRKASEAEAGSPEAGYAAAQLKELHKMEGNLYTTGFKDSVAKECVGLFYEDDFAQKLDANPYLLGFTNGVLNLRAERTVSSGGAGGPSAKTEQYCEFREGKPEDYISFQAGKWLPKLCDPIPYVPYKADDPEQAEIDDFMAKVFPRPELRAYMWRKLASCLEGTNKEQRYDTWIGIGGNGKSKLVDLMSMALGDYAVSLQSTVLTRKRPDSGAANPDIMAVRNRRFIYMAEPDDGEPLNTSRMKQFTGEDVVEARGLFEDQAKFQIAGKMFMLCNKFPAIHNMDRGTWRRVMAVPFESMFVDPDSEEGKEINPDKKVWPRDPALDAKLKRWRIPFMARLVHVYETEYLKTGIEPIPAIVTQESANYRSQFDSFGKFMQARIRKEMGSEATLKDVWHIYKQWSEAVGSAGGKKLTMAELQKRCEDQFGVPHDKKTYKQMRLFESDEDAEEFDEGAA